MHCIVQYFIVLEHLYLTPLPINKQNCTYYVRWSFCRCRRHHLRKGPGTMYFNCISSWRESSPRLQWLVVQLWGRAKRRCAGWRRRLVQPSTATTTTNNGVNSNKKYKILLTLMWISHCPMQCLLTARSAVYAGNDRNKTNRTASRRMETKKTVMLKSMEIG